MKKYLLAVLLMLPTYSYAALNWTGGFGLRYTSLTESDGSDDADDLVTKTVERRAHLGVGMSGDKVSWGVQLRTGAASVGTYWSGTEASNPIVDISRAWFKYNIGMGMGSMDGTSSITLGRHTPIFHVGKGGLVLDWDVNLDGLGLNLNFGNFGINVSHYFLSDVDVSAGDVDLTARQFLLTIQPTFKFRLGNDVDLHVAGGYHRLRNNDGFGEGANTGVDPHFFQGLAKISLPNMIHAEFEYIKNSGIEDDDATEVDEEEGATGYSAAVSYGKIEKAHDFVVGAMYQKKGESSVISDFTYNKWDVGNKGFGVGFKYALAKNLHLKVKYLSLETADVPDGAEAEEEQYLELAATVGF